jgi:hypothetical protein
MPDLVIGLRKVGTAKGTGRKGDNEKCSPRSTQQTRPRRLAGRQTFCSILTGSDSRLAMTRTMLLFI